MSVKTPSKLEKILSEGHLAVTSECGPPRGSDPEAITKKAELIKDYVDAINITDNQTSVTRMCSLAACIRLKLMGLEPVLQMVTRDRNRIALQSDILGAASFDIHNILCLSGDHQSFGDCAQGQNVHDIDSMQLIQTVRYMRDERKFLGGDEINRPPQMFVGAAANPFADPFEIRVPRLAKKIAAGVEFIQTQCIYNLDKFEEWMKGVRDRGLHDPTKLSSVWAIHPKKSRLKKESKSALNPSNDSSRWRVSPAFISWPSNGRKWCPRSWKKAAFIRDLRLIEIESGSKGDYH
jgi:methylenetetrahydrofolate reductase (NADPH)